MLPWITRRCIRGLSYHGAGRQLEYDFRSRRAATHARSDSPSRVPRGSIWIRRETCCCTPLGDLVEHAPVIYQGAGADREAVTGGYVRNADGSVGFAVGAY